MVEIEVKSDYDSYFEKWVRRILSELEKEGRTFTYLKKVVVSAGPWRTYGLRYEILDADKGVVLLDFYSGLRAGFGHLSDEQLKDVFDYVESALRKLSKIKGSREYFTYELAKAIEEDFDRMFEETKKISVLLAKAQFQSFVKPYTGMRIEELPKEVREYIETWLSERGEVGKG
jgi:hypothetical protein